MLGWHGTVMVRVSRRKVLVRDDDTVLGTHKQPAPRPGLRQSRDER